MRLDIIPIEIFLRSITEKGKNVGFDATSKEVDDPQKVAIVKVNVFKNLQFQANHRSGLKKSTTRPQFTIFPLTLRPSMCYPLLNPLSRVSERRLGASHRSSAWSRDGYPRGEAAWSPQKKGI
jgi:hypothetical protein